MKILIRKNRKYGHFEYKSEGDQGFKIIPSWVDSKLKIIQWYMAGGHADRSGQWDRPQLVFCNEQGTPVVHYTIKSGEKYAGHQFAIVDHDPDKKFLFDSSEVVPVEERLEWLLKQSTYTQDQEANKLESDADKVKLYLSTFTEETKLQYKQFLDERMTPEAIQSLCAENAKTYELPAEVEII